MIIFNIQVWGEDADKFMALSCSKKKQFIKEHTNQKNDALIDEFIKYAKRGNDDECQGCKEEKAKITHNVTERISKAAKDDTKQGNPTKHSLSGNKGKGSRAKKG